MKGRIIALQCHFKAGTKEMYKFPELVKMKVIEVLHENGTDLLFGYIEGELVYVTPSCIKKFLT